MARASNTRKRIAIAAIAAGVVVAVVAVVIAADVTHSTTGENHPKEVAWNHIARNDALVVLPAGADDGDAAAIRSILDKNDAVTSYGTLPLDALVPALSYPGQPKSARGVLAQVCKDRSARSFAVELGQGLPNAGDRLTSAIGSHATALVLGDPDVDVEIFMQVKASKAATGAVRGAQLAADSDVAKVTFVDHDAAFARFRKQFSDTPKLVENETASDLPESFDIRLRAGGSATAVANRYQHRAQVAHAEALDRHLTLAGPKVPAGKAEIFMQVALAGNDTDVAALRSHLQIDPRVRSFDYLDHNGAYSEFKRLFADQPDLVQNETPEQLPTSFRVTLRSQADATGFEHDYAHASGVKSINTSTSVLDDACRNP